MASKFGYLLVCMCFILYSLLCDPGTQQRLELSILLDLVLPLNKALLKCNLKRYSNADSTCAKFLPYMMISHLSITVDLRINRDNFDTVLCVEYVVGVFKFGFFFNHSELHIKLLLLNQKKLMKLLTLKRLRKFLGTEVQLLRRSRSKKCAVVSPSITDFCHD